jgi:hypothetical protein
MRFCCVLIDHVRLGLLGAKWRLRLERRSRLLDLNLPHSMSVACALGISLLVSRSTWISRKISHPVTWYRCRGMQLQDFSPRGSGSLSAEARPRASTYSQGGKF